MKLSVYIATSVDGFIARKNGDLDWLPQSGYAKNIESDEDYGFGAFFKSVDTLIMGRNTYDTVQKFDTWPYSNKHVVVLTNRGIDIPDNIAQNVVAMSGAPEKIVKKLEADGARHLYIDGGNVIQHFLREGLITELIITKIPILLGSGILLFGEVDKDIILELVSVKTYDNGMVQIIYKP